MMDAATDEDFNICADVEGRGTSDKTVKNLTMDKPSEDVENSSYGDMTSNTNDTETIIEAVPPDVYAPKKTELKGSIEEGIAVSVLETTQTQDSTSKSNNQEQNMFGCTQCDKLFKQRNHLRLHEKCHTRKIFGEKQKRSYKRHYVHKKQNLKKEKCEICKRFFCNQYALKQHINTIHLDIRPFQCPYCPERFSQKTSWKTHKLKKHEECSNEDNKNALKFESLRKEYKCDVCDKIFMSEKRYSTHQEKHKLCAVKKEKIDHNIVGHSVQESLTSVDSLMIWNISNGRYKCPLCSKDFSCISTIKRHYGMTHLGKYPYSCPICGKGFSDRRPIRSHFRVSHPDHSSIPEIKSNKALRKQEQVNEASGKTTEQKITKKLIRRPECMICNKQFACRLEVKVHIRSVHGDVCPTKCKICGKAFSDIFLFCRHMKIVHRIVAKSVLSTCKSKSGNFTCRICGYVFTQNSTRSRHERRFHPNVPLSIVRSYSTSFSGKLKKTTNNDEGKPYACQTCGLRFAAETNYKRHYTMKHGIASVKKYVKPHKVVADKDKPFSCETCGKHFLLKFNCRRHQKLHEMYLAPKCSTSNISSLAKEDSEIPQKPSDNLDVLSTCPDRDDTPKTEDFQTDQNYQHSQEYGKESDPHDKKTGTVPDSVQALDFVAKTAILSNAEGNVSTDPSLPQGSVADLDTAEVNKFMVNDTSFSEDELKPLNGTNIDSGSCKDKSEIEKTEEKTHKDVFDNLKARAPSNMGEESSKEIEEEESMLKDVARKELSWVSAEERDIAKSGGCSDDDYGFEYDDDDNDDYEDIVNEVTTIENNSAQSINLDASQMASSSKDTSSQSFSSCDPEPEWVYHCPACSKGFVLSIELVMHIKSHMEQSSESLDI